MTASIRNLSIAVLVVAGILSMGEGTRIYLKAILAQILLQNAWSQTQAGKANVKPWPWAEMHPVARLQAGYNLPQFKEKGSATPELKEVGYTAMELTV